MNARHTRAGALGFLGAAALAPALPALAQATPVRVGASASDSFAIAFFAADGGFYQKAGLDVTLTQFPGSGPTTTALAGGAIDVGITDIVQLANAYNRGIPITAIAGAAVYAGEPSFAELCVGKASTVRTAKDFEGKTIAIITLGSISDVGLRAWLTKHGADPKNVKIIEMPFAEMAPAIARGTIDGAFITEPVLTQVMPDIRIVTSPFDAIAPEFAVSVWVTNQDWIAKNHETAKRLVGAIYDASRWANDHRDLTLPILVKYAKLNAEKTAKMRRARYATALDTRLMQPVLDAAATYNAIQKPVTATSVIAKL